jgi:hypothetical protein
MSGNTKLIGFAAGNKAVLERWGDRTEVELSSNSIRLLTDAVRDELPSKPPVLEPGDDSLAHFNPQTGRVLIDMDSAAAESLTKRLEASKVTLHILSEKEAERVGDWISSLKRAVQAHKDYFDRDEPGLT